MRRLINFSQGLSLLDFFFGLKVCCQEIFGFVTAGWVHYISMLNSDSIVLACFCFKISFILFDKSSFFDFFVFFLMLKACGNYNGFA